MSNQDTETYSYKIPSGLTVPQMYALGAKMAEAAHHNVRDIRVKGGYVIITVKAQPRQGDNDK